MRPRRGRSRSARAARLVGALLLLAAVFVAGVGVGEALRDRRGDAGTQTLVRTLHPLDVAPLATTVTVTSPTP